MPNYRSSQVDDFRRRLEAEQLLNSKLYTNYNSVEFYVVRNVVAWVLAFFFFYLVIY